MSSIKYIHSFVFLCIFLGFLSCQQEEDMEIPVENTEDIVTDDLAQLLMKVVVEDTETVIGVDHRNCLVIRLPEFILYNGDRNNPDIIRTEEDYFRVIDSIGRNGFEWTFPVRINRPDGPGFTLLDTREELDELEKETCGETTTVISNNIACVDFIYPFDFKMFNTSTSTFKTITVNEDREVQQLINEKSLEERVSIDYPIVLNNLNINSSVQVSGNQELSLELESADNSCL